MTVNLVLHKYVTLNMTVNLGPSYVTLNMAVNLGPSYVTLNMTVNVRSILCTTGYDPLIQLHRM